VNDVSPLPRRTDSAAEPGACLHCGTPTSSDFCCAGCSAVYALLRSSGLDDYYALRNRLGDAGQPVSATAGDFADFDAATFQALYCRDETGVRRSAEFALSGLHCAACVWLVERLPRLVPAVEEARVDFARSRVRVVWRADEAPLSDVARGLADLGYEPSAPRGAAQDAALRRELRGLLIRLGVAGACAGNVMLVSFALYSGAASGMDPGMRRFFELGSLALSLPALVAGSVFFRGAWASLRARTVHMDLPIAIGIAVGFGWGAWGILTGFHAAYFDSITTLIFLLLIGRYLQRRHQLGAAEAAELLHSVTPAWTRLARGSGAERSFERVAAETVVIGDVVEVRSGEVVPIDGVVVSGTSAVDMSLLSGESEPVEVTAGSPLQAGCVNRGASLQVRAECTRDASRIAVFLRAAERSLLERTPLTTTADRVARVFTLFVLSAAVTTIAYWWTSGSARALENGLALLIVSCPCALAMATPLALDVATRQAARAKIIFFRGQALEQLAVPSVVVLDKTGTLTEGCLGLTRWDGDVGLEDAVRALEAVSEHPVARALRPLPERDAVAVDRPREEMGQGVLGSYSGKTLVVGSERFVLGHLKQGATSPNWRREGPHGASPLFVVWGGELRAIAWLVDRLRPNVAAALGRLRELGHELVVLSGDHPDVVRTVADELTVQYGQGPLFFQVEGGTPPDGKSEFVARLRAAGRAVIMVGDGVNDAGALASANVGVAVRGAAEASRLSADVFLAAGGVGDLAQLMTGARRCLRTIQRGMAFSLVYNAIGIGLAVAGRLNPLIAAVLMPLSSLTVVTHAYRSTMFTSRSSQP